MQPQMLQYSNASDEEKLESKKNRENEHRSNLMVQSTYGVLPEDTEWSDFRFFKFIFCFIFYNLSVEEEPSLPMSSRMWTSMHEALFAEPRRQTRNLGYICFYFSVNLKLQNEIITIEVSAQWHRDVERCPGLIPVVRLG